VNGPAPVAGVTVTISAQVVELRLNPAELPDCDTETLNVGEPAPMAKNERFAGTRLMDGVAVGPAVGAAVGALGGAVVGVVVGAVVGVAVGAFGAAVVGAVVGALVGVAVGALVGVGVGAAVGVVLGVVGGAVVGEVVGLTVALAVGGAMAMTDGEGLDDPPPPQATRETATMPAKTEQERKLGLTRSESTRACALDHTPIMSYDVLRRREPFA
jgi:hypothetical protein